ncbi:uncharacterized protein LOC107036415 [Diachasma alloeum]|uniref:uncharacterized protein LOC107036415 n=1 Tax=Diachasma alloeum TaxID=454923 RepID=UPI00073811D1|nr:uncharacterized protein LOC107036415 [Diachasma alloeum]
MKVHVLLSLIIGAYGHADWTSDLLSNIHRMTENIHNNVHQIQERVQANVRDHLARIDHLNHDINQRVAEINKEVENAGPTLRINSNGGSSRSIISGHLPNGEPYFRDVEERTIGDTLHRFENVYNPKTQQMERYHTTLDLKDPNAKPVPVPVPGEAKAPGPEETKAPGPEETKAPGPEAAKPPEDHQKTSHESQVGLQ